ncbi:MAG: O-antigen polymerase [Acidobacteriaceae bacterium]|nr:O-antigen polymerase [Acidobacteriaceae bacterium]
MIAHSINAVVQPNLRTSSAFTVPGIIGIYFGLRACITFLFFQADPQTGTQISLALNFLLLVAVAFYVAGPVTFTFRRAWSILPFRLVVLFLVLTLVSLTWSEAQSIPVAFAYWCAPAADVALVFLLLQAGPIQDAFDSLIKGFVAGVAILALIAWAAPTMPDLRIGSDDFLSPNVIGFEAALGVLLCQYLAPHGSRWKWLGAALALTLLRSLSKTSIFVFLFAEAYFLTRTTTLTRTRKLALIGAAALVLLVFSSLLIRYYDLYINAGTQAETLTGRTIIWFTSLNFAFEEPWLGHGFHSFHSVVPAFGPYQAWHAHNELLHQFFSYGIPGVVLVIALYVSLIRQLRQPRWMPTTSLNLVARALLLMTIARGFVEAERFDLSYPLWAMTAITLTLAKSQEAPL